MATTQSVRTESHSEEQTVRQQSPGTRGAVADIDRAEEKLGDVKAQAKAAVEQLSSAEDDSAAAKEKLKDELLVTKDRVQGLQREVEVTKASIPEYEQRERELRSRVEQTEGDKTAQLEAVDRQLQQAKEGFDADVAHERQRAREAEEQLKGHEARARGLESEAGKAKGAIADRERSAEEAWARVQQLEEELDAERSKVDQLTGVVRQKENKEQDLVGAKEAADGLQREVQGKESKVQDLAGKLSKADQDVDYHRREASEVGHNLSAKIRDLEEQLKQKTDNEKAVKDIKSNNESLQNLVNQMRKEAQELRNKLEEKTARHESNAKRAADRIVELEKMLAGHQGLKKDAKTKTEQVQTLKSAIVGADQHVQKLESEAANERTNLRNDITALKKENDSLRSQLHALQDKIHGVESHQKSAIDSAEQRRQVAERDASSLAEELVRKGKGLRELDGVKREVADKTKRAEDAQNTAANLQDQIRQYQENISSLERKLYETQNQSRVFVEVPAGDQKTVSDVKTAVKESKFHEDKVAKAVVTGN